jgi:hypothetical protein
VLNNVRKKREKIPQKNIKKKFSTEEKSKIMYWGDIGIKSKEIAAKLGHRDRAVRIHLSVLKKLPPPKRPDLDVPARHPRPRTRG